MSLLVKHVIQRRLAEITWAHLQIPEFSTFIIRVLANPEIRLIMSLQIVSVRMKILFA